jgi:DNA-nicking Smr family endonuclease
MSADDADLWQSVADTAQPLRKGKNRVVDQPASVDSPAPEPARKNKKPSQQTPPPVVTPTKPPAPPPVADFDRKEARRLGSGRISVDARIDLHGMRQREAYGSLKAFLARAQDQGHRHVLVITGKGGRREHDWSSNSKAVGQEKMASKAQAVGQIERSFERGVLNREAPRWLSEPEFRQWVVSFTPASKRHGGEGALYVRLRRG